MKSSGENTIEV